VRKRRKERLGRILRLKRQHLHTSLQSATHALLVVPHRPMLSWSCARCS
jgi:hypothetical protein